MDVEILQQINDQLKEMNDLMGRQTAAMSSQAKAVKASTDAANNQRTSNSNLNSAQTDAGNKSIAQTKLSEMSRLANEKTAAATNQLSKSFAEGKNALFGLASALLDTTPGLSKYSNSIESATGAVAGVTSIFGPLGAVAGLLLKGFGALAGAALKYSDSLVSAYDKFAEAGAGIGSSAESIMQLGKAAGLSSGTLPYLTKNIEALGSDLRALGTTSSGGAEQFARIIAVGDKQLQGYRKLGFTQEELIESQKTYLQLQAQAGADLKRSPQELQKASLKYIDELNAFAEVTGISKKRQEDAMAQALAQENFNAYMNKLENDKKEALAKGDKAQAEHIDSVIKAKNSLAKYAIQNFSAAKAQAVLEGISTDGNTIMTENTAKLKMSGINIEKINANANKGIDQTGELAGQSALSTEQFRKNFGDLGTAAGKESRNLQDTYFQDNGTRMAANRDADLKGEDRQKIYNQRMENARKAAEIAKNRKDGEMARRAAIEAQERALRKAFDDLLAPLSAQMTALLMKVLPYVTKSIQFVSDHFTEITKAAKALAIFFVGLGAVAGAGKIIGSIRSFGGKVAGLFGKKSGALGSETNPMYISESSGGGLGGKGGATGKKGRFGRLLKGAGKVALAGAGIAAAGWMASSAMDAFEDDTPDGDEALKEAGVDMEALNAEQKPASPKDSAAKLDPAKMEQSVKALKELDQAKIDPKRVEANSKALVALPNALSTLPENAGSGDLTPLSDIVGDSKLLKDFAYFSNELKLDPKLTKNNAEAFKYFSDALSSFEGVGSPVGVIGTALADASIKFFKVRPPLDQFTYFSQLPINPKRTKSNADAFVKFSEAMASYKGGQGLLSAVSTIAASKLNSLFGQDSAIDAFDKFSKEDFGKDAEKNSKAFLDFSVAMGILSNPSGYRSPAAPGSPPSGSPSPTGPANVAPVARPTKKEMRGNAGLIYSEARRLGYDHKMAVAFVALAQKETGLNPRQAENLNYSAKRILEVWKGRITPEQAQALAGNPPALANFIYGKINGNQGGNDGWLYRGRGFNGITGRGIYAKVGSKIGVDLVSNPDALYDPALAAKAMFAFFADHPLMKGVKGARTQEDANRLVTDANGGVKRGFSTRSKFGQENYAKVAQYAADWDAAGLKARKGGLFRGPTGGYPIELHGTELVIPVTPDSILTKLMEDTPDAEKMSNEIFKAVAGTLDGNPINHEVDELLEQDTKMKTMLVDKFNKILDILEHKQTTSGKLLKRKLAS